MPDLRHKVTLQARAAVSDNYGNETAGAWTDQFTVRARIHPPRAGREEILAQQLQGVRPAEIDIYQNDQTRAIQVSWRLKDARTGEIYAIHDVRDPTGNRQWLTLTCTLGGAS